MKYLLCVIIAFTMMNISAAEVDQVPSVQDTSEREGAVGISDVDKGLRTISVCIKERKKDTDAGTKINAVKDAIKELKRRLDVLEKIKKDEEPKKKSETDVPVGTDSQNSTNVPEFGFNSRGERKRICKVLTGSDGHLIYIACGVPDSETTPIVATQPIVTCHSGSCWKGNSHHDEFEHGFNPNDR